jgi:hypothetical protein
MKVYMGPYVNYFGPYQLAEKILFWMDKYEDERVDKFGEFLAGKNDDSLLYRFLRWVESKRNRTVYVKIDNWDYWSADTTLSYIVVPLLKKLKDNQHGYPIVDDEDVPEKFRTSTVQDYRQLELFPEKEKAVEETIIELNEMKWDWVLNEIIWAHSQIIDDNGDSKFFDHSEVDYNTPLLDQVAKVKVDRDGLDRHHERIDNGLRLFGKYYRSLWD